MIDRREPLASLRLSGAQAAAVFSHLRSVYPEEGCGLLAVPADADRVVQQYSLRNIADEPWRRFLADDLGLVEALLEIERRGWRLGAIYHSHPRSPAWPSQEDISQARYPAALTLIVSFAELERPRARLFALAGERIEERQLLIDDEPGDTR